MARDHSAHREDIGAYLLGALSELEARAFERHLMGCSQCRDELVRLRAAVEALPRSVTPVNAPPGLKRSLMDVVEREARERAPSPRRRRLLERLPQLPRVRPALAWVSAAFLLAVGIAFGAAAATLLGGDEAQTVSAHADSKRAPFANGSLVVPADSGKGAILRVNGMPTLRSNTVYQVWLARSDEVVSQSIFNVGEDGRGAGAVTDDLEGADAVLVTREPAGGARAPSERPILRVEL